MFKRRKYIRPRISEAANEFHHVLDEATLLTEALVLQQAGTNLEKFKNMDFKKASIDSLNDVLYTMKNLVKKKIHFLDDIIDNERENCLEKLASNPEFANVIEYSSKLNLIADNNDISLYLSPYIDHWEILTAGVRTLIINHVIRSINLEIQRAQLAQKISKKF